jgi:hypothetical protein
MEGDGFYDRRLLPLRSMVDRRVHHLHFERATNSRLNMVGSGTSLAL